ncbi:MAG TPA: trypsin-like peptidase domain-containing protein [Bacteroidia bacterium]|nr:trypsin-like peptidase domain-containing protein [Bacteroidia bacterium]
MKDDDTKVEILGCKNSKGAKTDNLYSSADYQEVSIINKKGTAALNNSKDFYVINQYKKGCLPSTTIIARTQFNALKVLDILPPAFCDAYLFIQLVSTNGGEQTNAGAAAPTDPAFWATIIGIGTLGWFDQLAGPWKTYPSTYDLPALTRYPHRDTSESRVYVRDANISLEKYSFKEYFYKNYEDYLAGNEQYRATSPDEFKYSNRSLKDTLNNLLGKWSFMDTTAGHLGFMYNSGYYIKCDLTGAYLNTVRSLSSFTLDCDWRLFSTISDKAVYMQTLNTPSKWGYINGEENTVNDYLKDGFEKGLAQFVNSPGVALLLEQKTSTADTIKTWNTVHFTRTDTALNLQEAVKSVVTVKTSDGHGSGCIVSNDGYVITNYHVIADNDGADVEIIFSNGDTTKAQYIRSNAEYDLALLKIRKPGPYKSLRPSLSSDINIGSEVFAIGTPEDIELGQTLTKGIISGQRKVGEKQIIQTDVSINPGNSGGALVTKDGTLLGIVNAKISGISVQGIGFAIPARYITAALKVEFK